MACALQTPLWVLPHQSGLQAALEVPAESAIALSWGTAIATTPAEEVYYNIYWSENLATVFDTPKAFSTANSAKIPKTIADDGYFFGVRAAQLGTTSDFSGLSGSTLIDTLTWAYPNSVSTTSPVDTTAPVASVPVDGYSGFPLNDGYLQIGTDILFYPALDTATSTFTISSSDPFGCNDGYAHPTGTSVSLFKGFEEGNTAAFLPVGSCNQPPPVWQTTAVLQGLRLALDMGIGTVVQLDWPYARPPSSDVSDIFYNLYWSTSRDGVFDTPRGITQSQSVLVPDLSPGTPYYFAVRASYFTTDWDITELNQLSEDLYGYPTNTVVSEGDGYYNDTDLSPLTVSSTTGFPNAGFLLLDAEVVEYSSKTATTFNVTKRDVFDFGQTTTHPNGTEILLYAGIEDSNDRVFKAVPSWDARQDTPNIPVPNDGYTLYLQDEDGYRSFPVDNVTEDHSDFEDENSDFNAQPYCGYRAQNFVDLYSQNTCGTYFGGQFGGGAGPEGDGTGTIPGPIGGGINITEINLQREELLLGLTGEPFILLERKWTGKTCAGISHRHEHPHARCPMCFGTGFEGGYDRYTHTRQIRPGEANPNGLISLRVEPYDNDLDLNPERGLTQIDQIRAWGTAIPTIKDRDILIRFISDNSFGIIGEEFRYEVLVVNRNRILFSRDGRQQITLRKLDRTDPIYHFPVTLV